MTNRIATIVFLTIYGAWPFAADAAPFHGTPISIPGVFEAEDFDTGGEGFAYHDAVSGNAGSQYRPNENVDIFAGGTGFRVANIQTGEWLTYTINVTHAGAYAIEALVATEFSNSAFHVEIDGADATGSILVPNTGRWSYFRWIGAGGVNLSSGEHVLKLYSEQEYFDLDAIRVRAQFPLEGSAFSGQPAVILCPGGFEDQKPIPAENFDQGGEGFAYHDAGPGNAGGLYRTNEDVDIFDNGSGGYKVANFQTGEWMTYSLDVRCTGPSAIYARASSMFSNSRFHAEIDGMDVTGSISVPTTSYWNDFQVVGRGNIDLSAGFHILKIYSEQEYFDLDSISVFAGGLTPWRGGPAYVPGIIEAETFDRFHELSPGNSGDSQYRGTDVDISALGSGYKIVNFQTGEWLAYMIQLPEGVYRIEARASSMFDNSRFHIEIDSVDRTGSILVPTTSYWNDFVWIGADGIDIPAGNHMLTIVSDQEYFDLDAIRIVAE